MKYSKLWKVLIAASLITTLFLGLGWWRQEVSIHTLIVDTIKGNKTTSTITNSNPQTFSSNVTFQAGRNLDVVYPSVTASTGSVINGSECNIYMINSGVAGGASVSGPCAGAGAGINVGPEDGTGVTVVLPTLTAALDGVELTFVNWNPEGQSSGGTDVFLWADGATISGGTPISVGTSGNHTHGSASVSSCTDFLVVDRYGDSITVVGDYNSGVSWIVTHYYVH